MTKIELDKRPCESLLVPDSWLRTDEQRDSGSWMIRFAPRDNAHNTFLGIYDRGKPVNDSALALLRELLLAVVGAGEARELQEGEIKNLAPVMGTNSVGDNQFTNANKYPDPRSPVFSLDHACLKNIQGHMVLEVSGKYLDQKGVPTNFFRGIFIPSQDDSNKVREVFLQTNSETEFKKNEEVYRNAVESITW
jgi:hypothetical protein